MAGVHIPLYKGADTRRIERDAGQVHPPLMERAGAAAADLAARLASDKQKDILVLAGPGNNGGDAKIAAGRLKEQFYRVTVATSSAELPEANWALVIDGLFGIGLARDIDGDYARLVDYA